MVTVARVPLEVVLPFHTARVSIPSALHLERAVIRVVIRETLQRRGRFHGEWDQLRAAEVYSTDTPCTFALANYVLLQTSFCPMEPK